MELAHLVRAFQLMRPSLLLAVAGFIVLGAGGQGALAQGDAPRVQPRHAWFGDLHVHTANSVDAYWLGMKATPDDAYRYAQGAPVVQPDGRSIRLHGGPLDFYAVADHAEYLGVLEAFDDPAGPLGTHPLAKLYRSGTEEGKTQAVVGLGTAHLEGKKESLDASAVIRSVWQENIEAAERHNRPGRFTTFIAYEYSSASAVGNLHRNVIFSGSAAPAAPFSAIDSPEPEDLWNWMDALRALGIEALAIPHNSNWSQGLMFERTTAAGEPLGAAWAEQRSRNEPLVELTQSKGTSETHPLLSPNDEWAQFEIWAPSKGAAEVSARSLRGSYVRDALRAGLEIEETSGTNPYRVGFIGSTDSHNAASPVEEASYFGVASDDTTPQERLGLSPASPDAQAAVEKVGTIIPLQFSASGLAGVWAEENTRASIYAALRRKETFATSGPRMRVRLFAGYDYPDTLPSARDAIERAYADGVPMGAELVARDGATPRWFLWALRDPRGSWLDRAQIVKGWVDGEGVSHEQVFDAACSDGAVPNPKTHRCPDNGATVNVADCSVSLDKGAVELRTVWRDPTFDPSERAFYYLRVLQNPTCRWSTWDAVRTGATPDPKVTPTLQERAWSSPIWYVPAG